MQTTIQTQNQKQQGDRRNLNKRANAIFLKFAGKRFRAYSILKHIGRKSGREYLTPVTAYPLGDGFVVALLYGDGANVDWCRNVMTTGKCTLKTLGQEYMLERPEIIPASQALQAYPLFLRLYLVSRRIQQFLWVHQQIEAPEKSIGSI